MVLPGLPFSAGQRAVVAARPTPTMGVEIVLPRGYSRHDARIARIMAISQSLGAPISVSYLDSCDVRALPLILERLERRAQRHRAILGHPLTIAWWQR
jgi:hypothetical protein